MQAMVLAAGFGTRLLPHTEVKPKPLFPILNKPLLLLTIERLQRAGFDNIVVNCHYLREQIIAAIENIPGVIVQEELEILGTGGGLKMACRYFRDEPVLVTNGDIYHTVNYENLYTLHGQHDATVTLALHDYPRFNCIEVQQDAIQGFRAQGGDGLLAFTGLHVLDPVILEQISSIGSSCIIDRYKQMLEEKEVLKIARVDDCYWTDMGTVEDYLSLHGGLIRGDIPLWEELASNNKGSLCVDGGAKINGDVRIVDWACIGNAEIDDGVSLERSIVWDHVKIPKGAKVVDSLVTHGG